MNDKLKKKLLVVDDSPQHCELAKRNLTSIFEIEVAFGGEEAISQIYNFEPEVILLDIKMPRLTGDELVKMIKAWKPKIHVIMVSANITPEIQEECMKNGAFDCITKPFDYKYLKKVIEKALNQ